MESTRNPGAETLLLGGDYVEDERYLDELFDHLASLYTEVFAIYGNNDTVVPARKNLRILRDEVAKWNGINILGTRDPARDNPRLPPLPPDPLLVLSHSPDILLKLPADRRLLVLAGHVHGGQFRPSKKFWWSHTRIGRKYGDGYSRRRENHIFVGRGIGYSVLPLRNVPKEIYTITLMPESSSA